MDYNICSGSEITRKTLLISCLYRSYTLSKTFESDFRQLFVLKVFNRFISGPILLLHLLHLDFITTFSLFKQSRSKSAFLVVALRVFCFPACFSLINKVTAAAPILGSKKRSYEYYG